LAMLEAPWRLAPIVAVVVALSVGGIGNASGNSHASADPAIKAKGKKKNHVLSADYKTAPVSVIDEPTPTTVEFSDDAKLVGRPFGNLKAHLDENSVLTYNQPITGSSRTDYSGSFHVTFKAVFFSDGAFFRGFYDYSVDSNGDPSGPITGSITGGKGTFRGAKGSFQVVDFVAFHPESTQYKGHWQGSIRY
jgi:hypothetical protein